MSKFDIVLGMSKSLPSAWYDIMPHEDGQPGSSRGGSHITKHPYQSGVPNKHGVTPLQYEVSDRGSVTGWIRYRCGCEKAFWSREGIDKTECCMLCLQKRREEASEGGRKKLDLQGKKYGSIEVTGHEKGKGWKVRCACGRERHILNSTSLAAGIYKTCGQCTYEERERTAMEKLAGNGSGEDYLREICTEEHAPIAFYRSIQGDGVCPLCMAMARIELLEAEQAGAL